jgi:hypothetical protein
VWVTFQHGNGLFAFLERPAIEPPNNSVARALPHAVISRKNCFGDQSRQGEIASAPPPACSPSLAPVSRRTAIGRSSPPT